jgi:hypothetical protein
MRTIEESIAVLEKWRRHGIHRTWVILSAEQHPTMRRYEPPSVSYTGQDHPTGRHTGETIQEALDKAASEVSK